MATPPPRSLSTLRPLEQHPAYVVQPQTGQDIAPQKNINITDETPQPPKAPTSTSAPSATNLPGIATGKSVTQNRDNLEALQKDQDQQDRRMSDDIDVNSYLDRGNGYPTHPFPMDKVLSMSQSEVNNFVEGQRQAAAAQQRQSAAEPNDPMEVASNNSGGDSDGDANEGLEAFDLNDLLQPGINSDKAYNQDELLSMTNDDTVKAHVQYVSGGTMEAIELSYTFFCTNLPEKTTSWAIKKSMVNLLNGDRFVTVGTPFNNDEKFTGKPGHHQRGRQCRIQVQLNDHTFHPLLAWFSQAKSFLVDGRKTYAMFDSCAPNEFPGFLIVKPMDPNTGPPCSIPTFNDMATAAGTDLFTKTVRQSIMLQHNTDPWNAPPFVVASPNPANADSHLIVLSSSPPTSPTITTTPAVSSGTSAPTPLTRPTFVQNPKQAPSWSPS